MRRFDQGSGRVKASMPIRTVSRAPLEKNALTASGESPEARSARSTRSRQRAADGLADLGVVARRPALQHQHQPVAVGHHRLVRLAHRVQRLHPRLARARPRRRPRRGGRRARPRSRGRAPSSSRRAEQVRLRDAGRAAMSSVEAPWSPLTANSSCAASRTATRRSSAVWRGRRRHGSEYSLTIAVVKWPTLRRSGASAAATRSHSASVIVVANGSASARAKARSAPGKEPRSR